MSLHAANIEDRRLYCCVSKAIYYFIPSLVAIVRGIYFTHEDRVPDDNCLGFDLASDYTDIILNTVAAVVYNGVAFTWSLCSSCTEEKC